MRHRGHVSAVLALAALLATATAEAGSTPIVQPGEKVHLAGTRLYCGVSAGNTATLLTCVVVRKGTQTPEGYAVGISDRLAGVTHFVGTSAPAVFVHLQPAAAYASVGPAAKGSGTITLSLGQLAAVGGSHVVLETVRNARGDPSIVAGIFDTRGAPFSGTYTVGISERDVLVLRWNDGRSAVAYHQAQPAG